MHTVSATASRNQPISFDEFPHASLQFERFRIVICFAHVQKHPTHYAMRMFLEFLSTWKDFHHLRSGVIFFAI